ncbi:MAG: hypothetical protein DRP56_00855 [Planctomycetota bacterium]|nr:MAG: hypothetical protein DRP56_00855 [Planctomycetota bacterium]
MLKPSIKSVEGPSLLGVIMGCLGILYYLVIGDSGPDVPVEDLLKHAGTWKEISEAYKLDVSNIEGGWGTAKIFGILAFLYKMYGRFIDSRTELKKKEMEVT